MQGRIRIPDDFDTTPDELVEEFEVGGWSCGPGGG
jgi:hypothetical protein